MLDITFNVNDKQYYSLMDAVSYALPNNWEIEFNLFDAAFSKCNWAKDPDLSWDHLLDMRAKQIAAKGKPIVLSFSGGTDSYTIYKVFERNNIHLDAIYVRERVDPEDEGVWSGVHQLLHTGLYDKTTKIIYRKDDESSFAKTYSDKEWIWKPGYRPQFGIFASDPESVQYTAQILGTDDFINVSGQDKARLKFTDSGVYSYHNSTSFLKMMGYPQAEPFFVHSDLPELHIKQSYMLLTYIKSLEPTATKPTDLVKYKDIHYARAFNWYDYSIKGSGRFGDLARSDLQHSLNGTSGLLIANNKFQFTGNRGTHWFNTLQGTVAMKNYKDGVMDIASSAVGKFLLHDPANFYAMRTWESKAYKMTF
jgi:hypothetical protein